MLVLYSANLGHAPIYLHEAEVLFALHAEAIATTWRDTNGRLLPLYFQMPQIGFNVWFHPMVVYAMVPWLKILPLSEAAIRFPSVVVGLTDVVLIYFIAARIFRSERWGLLAAALLALTPSHFMHSRMAMDYLYPVPFVLAWLLCLLVFLDRQRPWTLFAATSFLGIGIYSYIASTIMMPLYLALTPGRHLGDGEPSGTLVADRYRRFCLAPVPADLVRVPPGGVRSDAEPIRARPRRRHAVAGGRTAQRRTRHDVADGATVRPGLAVLVVLRSGVPVPDGRIRQRRQLDAPRRRVSDVVPGAHPDRRRRARLAAASGRSTRCC